MTDLAHYALPDGNVAIAFSDEELTRMCLCVNQMFGNRQSVKLMNLILAAREGVEKK